MWFELYIDTYDQAGQLWRTHTIVFRSSALRMCYLPGRDTPEHECWYINQGAVDKDFFTVRAMEAASLSGH